MAIEQFANGASTTLAANIATTFATSISVTSSSGFPSGGNFRILIGTELMLVTNVSGTTWTVSRNVEGTTPATHTAGDNVDQILTAGAVTQYRADNVQRGNYASLPSAGNAGAIYLGNDSPVAARDNGSVWDMFAVKGTGFTDPNSVSWAWVNQNTATITSNYGGLYLSSPVVGSDQLNIYETTLTSNVAGHSATFFCCLSGGGVSSTNWHAGFCLRAPSIDNKIAIILLGGGNSNNNSIAFYSVTGPTSPSYGSRQSKTYTQANFWPMGRYFWIRRLLNSTNQLWQFSNDGITFATVITLGSTDSLSGTPTKIGFYVNNFTSSIDTLAVHILSFSQT